MKAVRKLIVLLGMGALLSADVAFATATENERTYLQSCTKEPGVPVPIAVVSPNVGSEYTGAQVQLQFVVDEAGRPAEFSIKSAPDDVLAKAVVEAVKKWRFEPAQVDGKPVAKRCTLPVRIVEPSLEGDRYATVN